MTAQRQTKEEEKEEADKKAKSKRGSVDRELAAVKQVEFTLKESAHTLVQFPRICSQLLIKKGGSICSGVKFD